MSRTKNGSTDPDGVLPLGRSDDLDLDARRGEGSQLLLHTVADTGVHRGSTRENDVAIEITTNIEIALEDRVITAQAERQCQAKLRSTAAVNLRRLVDAGGFETEEGRLEQRLRSTEPARALYP